MTKLNQNILSDNRVTEVSKQLIDHFYKYPGSSVVFKVGSDQITKPFKDPRNVAK